MRHLLAALVTCLCMLNAVALATPTLVQDIDILPITRNHLLVKLLSEYPIIIEVSEAENHPTLWLKETQITPALVTPQKTLAQAAYVYPLPYPVTVAETPEGTWLVFQADTPQVVLTPVTSEAAFLATLQRELPLYPQWPKPVQPSTVPPLELVNAAFTAFQASQVQNSTQHLETLYLTLEQPPKTLYELLGLLYLQQGDLIKTLAFYSQGIQKYPEAMGLRYAAVWYRLNQPQKSLQVLSDLLSQHNLPAEILAQLHYMMGTIHLEQHNYQQAMVHLKTAAQIFEQHPTVLYNLAIVYEHLDQPADALSIYQQVLEHAPNGFSAEVTQQIQRLQSQLDP